ncbi:ABC transporter ATP-binding protein [Lysinibacillus sp. fls2-241-R2A-57]|uniref:ATP-binding cassette domain-containing protein n=1 Tax=Lysinibacillus sp. fls2-241-R2A-57 TaxID=3040292 RepID=UPI00255730DB|nr:ABC transporter ATP-binding protein [Lysinibacillus sp. fls2-241-R2A-57]
MNQIRLINLKKYIKNDLVIDVEYLCFERGGIHALIGPNGAGKTTLLKSICGLVVVDEGEIWFDDNLVSQMDNYKNLQKIGTIFTSLDSISGLTVHELFEEHFHYYGVKKPSSWRPLLQQVKLNVSPEAVVGKMSLGMKQRLQLAIALTHNPEILVLDEPFNGLDPDGIELVKNILKSLAREKIILITSHTFADLEDISTDIVFMSNGKTSEKRKIDDINRIYEGGILDYYNQLTAK